MIGYKQQRIQIPCLLTIICFTHRAFSPTHYDWHYSLTLNKKHETFYYSKRGILLIN